GSATRWRCPASRRSADRFVTGVTSIASRPPTQQRTRCRRSAPTAARRRSGGGTTVMQRQKEEDLTAKVAIVTGASRGIGKRAALSLARRGVNVVVAARTVDANRELPGTIGETVTEIEAVGVAALAVATDLSNEDDLERLVRSAVERFGGVDILVNNA